VAKILRNAKNPSHTLKFSNQIDRPQIFALLLNRRLLVAFHPSISLFLPFQNAFCTPGSSLSGAVLPSSEAGYPWSGKQKKSSRRQYESMFMVG
jgi:hypothetical protein